MTQFLVGSDVDRTGLVTQQQVERTRHRRQRGGPPLGDAWLQTLSHTRRAYRTEVERFLL